MTDCVNYDPPEQELPICSVCGLEEVLEGHYGQDAENTFVCERHGPSVPAETLARWLDAEKSPCLQPGCTQELIGESLCPNHRLPSILCWLGYA